MFDIRSEIRFLEQIEEPKLKVVKLNERDLSEYVNKLSAFAITQVENQNKITNLSLKAADLKMEIEKTIKYEAGLDELPESLRENTFLYSSEKTRNRGYKILYTHLEELVRFLTMNIPLTIK